MFFNRSKIKYLMPMLFVVLLISCKAGMPEEQGETVFAVNTGTINRSEIIDYLELSGDVRTRNEVQVLPDTGGKLAQLLVSLGSPVSKDQIIGYIDPSRPGMEFSLSPVKSPISGTVISMPIKIGTTVIASTPIISVGKLADIEIVTYVSEKFISRIKMNQKVVINVDAYQDINFEGWVNELSPIVDLATRMMEIKIAVKPNNYQLKPGMFANLKIITDEKTNIIKIPSDTVITRFNNKLVFVRKKVPDSVTNIELDTMLLAKIDDNQKKKVLEDVFSPELPAELEGAQFMLLMAKLAFFDKEIKEIAKQKKQKKGNAPLFDIRKERVLIKKVYKEEGQDKDKKYRLAEDSPDEAKKQLWDLMIKINFSFDINKREIKTAEELEKIKEILDTTEYDRGYVEKRMVKTGIETEGMTEIVEGLTEGEEIVVLGQSLLEDSAKIKIMERTSIK